MADLWDDEDRYWRKNYPSRPYAKDRRPDVLSPGYRYGFESAQRFVDANGPMSSVIWNGTGAAIRIGQKHMAADQGRCARRVGPSDGARLAPVGVVTTPRTHSCKPCAPDSAIRRPLTPK